MNTQSKLVIVKQGDYQYIYVYYKYKDRLLRINTGNKVIPKCMTKEFLYTSKVEDYENLNYKTKRLKGRIDDYISYRLRNGWRRLSKEECMTFLESGDSYFSSFITKNETSDVVDLPSKKPLTVIQILERFYQFKKDELNNRPSYKDYGSLVNSLKDYENVYGIELTFEMMNTQEFMVKYRNFLSLKRGEGFLTKGGLNDNTINKRFSGLETFFLWLENREIYKFQNNVHSFRVPKFDNTIVVLDKNDISLLLKLELEDPTWIKIRDVFVCNCFMGLRYSDLKTIKKSDFYLDEDGDYILHKENKKTNFYVQIPIQKTSLEILQKYDFDLPKYSDQHFNRELRDMFKKYELFEDPIIKKRRVNKINEDKVQLRRELISSHTCRRTYITLGMTNNVPLNSLMLSTGHKKIQTLQGYMKKVLDKQSYKKIDL